MFRPINSDDHTRFRPPAEGVKQTEATYQGQKRDFSYEIEQVKDDQKNRQDKNQSSFGQDSFEPSADESNESPEKPEQGLTQDRKNKPPGHVDLQV
ncbi:hypothetical protein HUU59_00295 [bacterium]|nr:hypothetical protein [bacterium]